MGNTNKALENYEKARAIRTKCTVKYEMYTIVWASIKQPIRYSGTF